MNKTTIRFGLIAVAFSSLCSCASTLITDPVVQTYSGAPKPSSETAFIAHASYSPDCLGWIAYIDDLNFHLDGNDAWVKGLSVSPGWHRVRWYCKGNRDFSFGPSGKRGSLDVLFEANHRYLPVVTMNFDQTLAAIVIQDRGTNFDQSCLDDIVIRNAAAGDDKQVPGCMAQLAAAGIKQAQVRDQKPFDDSIP